MCILMKNNNLNSNCYYFYYFSLPEVWIRRYNGVKKKIFPPAMW